MRGSFPLLVASLLVAHEAIGQRASNWRAYKMADGLPESACISVSLAGQGKVLAKHFNVPAVTELDGYKLRVLATPQQSSSRVYASPGGQLWTAAAEGLQEFRESNWVLHPVPEIAGQLRESTPNPIDPVPLCPVKQGQVMFLLSDRLMKLNIEDPESPQTELLLDASRIGLGRLLAMTSARDGGLWLGGVLGLAKATRPARNIRTDTTWVEYLAPEDLDARQFTDIHETAEGSVTALAITKDHRRVMVHFDGHRWDVTGAGPERLRHVWRGPDGVLWGTTIDALWQWKGEWIESEEISARQYFDVAVEPNGIFWLATSDGLFRYTPLPWRSPLFSSGPFVSVVQCLISDGQERVWFVAGNSLHGLEGTVHTEFGLPAAALRDTQSTRALFALRDNSLLLETGEQFFRFDPDPGRFVGVEMDRPGMKGRALGLLRNRTVCLQVWEAGANGGTGLRVFDGEHFGEFGEAQPPGGIGTNLTSCYAAQNGDFWLSGEQGTACLHEGKWRTFAAADRSMPEEVVAFAEMPDGKIWSATLDSVWEFDGKNWSTMRAGFDRVSDLLRSRDGSIWVASNGGLYRYFQGAWVENSVEEGLPSSAVRKLCEDGRGKVWAGTIRGPSVYRPESDPDPPQTQVRELSGREKSLAQAETLALEFRGLDKWKQTPRDRLLYSYRLDDQDWWPFQESNHVTFSDLPAGKHYFQVRAMDRNCNVDPKPASVEFAVVLPWYRETRLLLIGISGLAAALFFAALAFNRHRQLLQSYAEVEQKVAQRTRELELANRELLHSQKMNALGTLAAGIAHDFNNILSIIKGSAQIIEDHVDQPQKVLTRTDRIKTVVEQGAGIVKAMLGFSRDSEQGAGVCDINQVVEDTLRLLGDRFLREVEVRFDPEPTLPVVPCAKDFLQQILLNFIFNAAEAMNGNRQIILTTRQESRLPEDLVLKPAICSGYLFVAVRDFGCGIAPENRARIFEPFFTTKALSARRGTGLGLSMVYQLATKMQAGLAVESVLEQGSTFTVILPVREAKPASDLKSA